MVVNDAFSPNNASSNNDAISPNNDSSLIEDDESSLFGGEFSKIEEEKKIDEEQGQENDEPYRVLIANDNPLQLTILQVIFEKCDFVSTTAQNG